MSNRPFSFPTYVGMPPNIIPFSSWGFTSYDSSFEDVNNYERLFGMGTDQMFCSDGLANNGDWNNYQGSVNPIITHAQALNRPLLSISFPAFPDSVGGTMTQAGNGAYVTHWQAAIAPIAAVFPGACYRFCVEFDGSWFPFGYAYEVNNQFANNQATYAADFSKAITLFSQTLKAIDGTAKVIFNTHYDASSRMPNGLWQSCLNGATGVDSLGVDIYDDSGYADNDPTHRWINTVAPTLNDMSALSLAKNLPIAVPEFGPGYMLLPNPTPDNPQWFRLLYAFMTLNQMSYVVMWNASNNGNLQWASGMRQEAYRLFKRYEY